MIANHEAYQDPFKKQKIDQIALLLKAVLDAESQVGLMMNIREADLPKLLTILPALNKPTISNLIEKGWVAINTVVEEAIVREFIPQLIEAGAEGIVEYSLNKLVR